ncbi:zinc finger protein 778 [Clonorchis sinensis]|uniref:Zinc finger protein 778 n=1 Tax=Clonorchis sinensis TaxID=79923 RepID=G7YHR1_CLOSI|nr:zinc finger protein 778 [Clonorchis sinensis]
MPNLRQHVRETHPDQVDYLPLKTPSKQVRESEERGNLCPDCGRNFASWDILRRHRKSLHGQGERHMCDECGKFLSHRHQLFRHIREMHKTEYHKQCEKCGEKFNRLYLLKRHIKFVHGVDQGEK